MIKGEGTKVTLHDQPGWCHMVYGICFNLSDVWGRMLLGQICMKLTLTPSKGLTHCLKGFMFDAEITRTTPFWMGQMHEPLWPGFLLFRRLCCIPHLDCRSFTRLRYGFWLKFYLLIWYIILKKNKI